MKGWIRLHRKILDNPIVMKDAEYFAVWVYILLHASHGECDVMFGKERISLHTGQLLPTSRKKIAEDLHISESKVERILKTFENEHQIEQQKTNKNRLISLVNWQKYQLSEQQIEQQVNNNRTTSEQQVNTINNIKNIEKESNINKLNNYFCSERSEIASEPPEEIFIEMTLNDGKQHKVVQKDVEEWKKLYPAVDVEQELRNMKGWLNANPTKRKTKNGINRFINNWLSKEQNNPKKLYNTNGFDPNKFISKGGE